MKIADCNFRALHMNCWDMEQTIQIQETVHKGLKTQEAKSVFIRYSEFLEFLERCPEWLLVAAYHIIRKRLRNSYFR